MTQYKSYIRYISNRSKGWVCHKKIVLSTYLVTFYKSYKLYTFRVVTGFNLNLVYFISNEILTLV